MNKFNLSLCLGLSWMLTACAVGPDYKMPKWPLPESWHAAQTAENELEQKLIVNATTPVATLSWWQIFHDEQLNGLIDRALAHNSDRAIANVRIMQARGNLMTATSALFPEISASAQGNRGNQAQNLIVQPFNAYTAAFDASYEIDLFGGNRRNREAATASVAAEQAHYQDVTISLVAEVVRHYALFRQFQSQLDFSKQTANAQEKLFAIVTQQFKVGSASQLDLVQAKNQYKNTLARIPVLQQQLAATGYALSVLLGENPGSLNDELREPKSITVPESLVILENPVAVIARRPDVKSAERRLASATALQGVAISQLYPTISLGSLLGYTHNSIAASGHVWSLSSNLAIPLLSFGKISGQIKVAKGQKKEAYEYYRKTVLQALADVETSVITLTKEHERFNALYDANDSAAQALTLAKKRYEVGTTSLSNELQAEQAYYSSQSDLTDSQANLMINIARLHKALGIGSNIPAKVN